MNRMMRAVLVYLFVCAVALTGCCVPRPRTHVFRLNETPKMLTEELAIEKAREALSKQGFDLERWQLRKPTKRNIYLPPSVAPDGTPDIYLERDLQRDVFGNWVNRTNRGVLNFTDGKRNRRVRVELESRLVCEVWQPP